MYRWRAKTRRHGGNSTRKGCTLRDMHSSCNQCAPSCSEAATVAASARHHAPQQPLLQQEAQRQCQGIPCLASRAFESATMTAMPYAAQAACCSACDARSTHAMSCITCHRDSHSDCNATCSTSCWPYCCSPPVVACSSSSLPSCSSCCSLDAGYAECPCCRPNQLAGLPVALASRTHVANLQHGSSTWFKGMVVHRPVRTVEA